MFIEWQYLFPKRPGYGYRGGSGEEVSSLLKEPHSPGADAEQACVLPLVSTFHILEESKKGVGSRETS